MTGVLLCPELLGFLRCQNQDSPRQTGTSGHPIQTRTNAQWFWEPKLRSPPPGSLSCNVLCLLYSRGRKGQVRNKKDRNWWGRKYILTPNEQGSAVNLPHCLPGVTSATVLRHLVSILGWTLGQLQRRRWGVRENKEANYIL